MKKFIFGLIVGLVIAVPVGAHAAAVDNLIGRLVEGVFPVKVNGTQIEKQAIVIDGTSYLPVRAIGDALNMDVSFNADLGVELNQRKAGVASLSTTATITETTYLGLKAIDFNGQTYFTLFDYNRKFNPFLWGYDQATNMVFLAETEKGTTTIKRKLVELNKDVETDIYIYNGDTYVNTKYYQEPQLQTP